MKIPASKVPAQVWADRARAHYGNLKKMEKDVLGYWEENKQVYRMNDALWDEMSIDEAEEFPMSLLDRLPYDCVFIQHRETIEFPFVFRGHELSGTVEREGYFCFRDAEGFHIAALNGQVDFMMGIVFKDTASLESFLGVRLDKSLGAMVRRAVRTMRGGKAD